MSAVVRTDAEQAAPNRAPRRESGRRSVASFYAWHAGLPAVLAALCLALFELTDLDRVVSNPFFDPTTRHFPLRSHWFLQIVIHDWAKIAVIVFAVVLLGVFVASFWKPRLRTWRYPALFVALSLGIAPGVVALMKDASTKHSPWDVDIYGGYAPYKKLLDEPAPGVRPGHGFPGGHASGGYALMSLYLALYHRNRRWAWRGLVLGLVYGTVLGTSRILQGAHFLSHNVASAFVCWYVSLVLYEIILRRREERAADERVAEARATAA